MEKYQGELEEKISIEEPKKYKVYLLNDDYSTMDFVIEILMKIFRKNFTEASQIMLTVHNNGKAICGVYPKEIAKTKVAQVKQLAKEAGFPLKAIMEQE